MTLIINITYGIKDPTPWISDCNSSQILMFGGYVKVRESLHI